MLTFDFEKYFVWVYIQMWFEFFGEMNADSCLEDLVFWASEYESTFIF